MVNCCVLYCTSGTKATPEGVSFHEIPCNPDIRKRWLTNIARKDWQPKDKSRVCSLHFKPEDFREGLKRKKLNSSAVPTILHGYPKYFQDAAKRNRVRKSPVIRQPLSQRRKVRSIKTSAKLEPAKREDVTTETSIEAPTENSENISETKSDAVPDVVYEITFNDETGCLQLDKPDSLINRVMTTSTSAQSRGMETSAISLLTRAVELDTNKRFTEALVCYQEGLQLLMTVMKDMREERKKASYRQKISEYMGRAEKLKSHIEQEKEGGRYHEEYHIAEDSINNSYRNVLGRFLDEMVTTVEIDDPYIRNGHQTFNFLRFCELLVTNCKNLKTVVLLTTVDNNTSETQKMHLGTIGSSLATHNISLEIRYSNTLHDREIRLDTGWVVKIGRGLDYFKNVNKFTIGFCDYDLRPCSETTVNIFHRKFTKEL